MIGGAQADRSRQIDCDQVPQPFDVSRPSWRPFSRHQSGRTARLRRGARVQNMDSAQQPESFRSLVLRDRGRTGLIQRDLAARAGVSLRSVQDWEGGVTLPNGDYVHVSPPCAAEFKGNVPVLQTEAWQALKSAKHEQLIKSGLVKIEPQWGRASGGRVSVKVF